MGYTVEHSYNKPEIPGQTVCYKQDFVTSEQFPMRYCSTWLSSLLCYIKKFVTEEFVIRVFHCTYNNYIPHVFHVFHVFHGRISLKVGCVSYAGCMHVRTYTHPTLQ